MNMDERERKLREKARKELDASIEGLDRQTLARLREARCAALAAAENKRVRWPSFPKWATAGGLASIAVMVVAVSLWHSASRQSLPVKQADDVEIITSQEHLEMYKDLEFYRWLADVDNGQ